MKIVSWNVNGVRAAVGKNLIEEVRQSQADVYCLQETKAQDDQVKKALSDLNKYHIYSNSAEKKGYSGVGIISQREAAEVSVDIGVEQHDKEGRVISADFGNFILVNVYVPNSGNGLARLDYRAEWDQAFAHFLKQQRKKKPIIVTGDFNVAHTDIDLARPKSNYNKTSGYTQTEIDGLNHILDVGLIDAFRYKHPDEVKYTFWSQRFGARAKNVGWRIDYFLVDERIKDNIVDCTIDNDIMGSDHCPVNLMLKF